MRFREKMAKEKRRYRQIISEACRKAGAKETRALRVQIAASMLIAFRDAKAIWGQP